MEILRTELNETNKRLKGKLNKQAKYEKEAHSLDILIEEQRFSNSAEIRNLLNKTKRKKDMLSDRLFELQKLLEQKVALGREIDTYKMLIEEEENRLCLSPVKKRKHISDKNTDSLCQISKSKRICRSQSFSREPQYSPLLNISPGHAESESSSPVSPSFVIENPESALHISIVDTNGRFYYYYYY